ncbi:Os12g0281900 [Oryza sativa Japonica Group]|uniref:Os12g0281900 protein n=1 Tax=Oryza sativa subsp. japonica TaxID=39947 RepID=A0A0N7KTW0_ORYSJ|nr:Os12g0281900 [Oryza sativa Japonica Group]
MGVATLARRGTRRLVETSCTLQQPAATSCGEEPRRRQPRVEMDPGDDLGGLTSEFVHLACGEAAGEVVHGRERIGATARQERPTARLCVERELEAAVREAGDGSAEREQEVAVSEEAVERWPIRGLLRPPVSPLHLHIHYLGSRNARPRRGRPVSIRRQAMSRRDAEQGDPPRCAVAPDSSRRGSSNSTPSQNHASSITAASSTCSAAPGD